MKEDFGNKFNDRWEQGRKRWEERMEHRSRHGHIWTGVFILLIGVAALLKITVTDLPTWIFSWKTFLIALGVFIGIKHSFKGSSWFILILMGVAFLLRDFYPDFAIRQYIWPIVLIIVGAFLIFRPRRRHPWECYTDQKKKSAIPEIDETNSAEEIFDSKDDFVESTSIFGGAKKNMISKNFKGGDLINIFGGTELDLTRADFKGTAVIELTTIFGGTKLIVPSNWTVRSEVVTIFGGMDDKRNLQTLSDNPERLLLLKGTVIFGGIEIKSY